MRKFSLLVLLSVVALAFQFSVVPSFCQEGVSSIGGWEIVPTSKPTSLLKTPPTARKTLRISAALETPSTVWSSTVAVMGRWDLSADTETLVNQTAFIYEVRPFGAAEVLGVSLELNGDPVGTSGLVTVLDDTHGQVSLNADALLEPGTNEFAIQVKLGALAPESVIQFALKGGKDMVATDSQTGKSAKVAPSGAVWSTPRTVGILVESTPTSTPSPTLVPTTTPSPTNSPTPTPTFDLSHIIYQQDFESLQLGSLAGQDSWVGSTEPVVTSNVGHNGSNALVLENQGTLLSVSRSLPNVSSGQLDVWVSCSKTADWNTEVQLRGDGGMAIRVVLRNGNITTDSLGYDDHVLLVGYLTNHWYKLSFRWADLTHIAVRLDDGTESPPLELYGGITQIDQLRIYGLANSTTVVDEIMLAD